MPLASVGITEGKIRHEQRLLSHREGGELAACERRHTPGGIEGFSAGGSGRIALEAAHPVYRRSDIPANKKDGQQGYQ